MHVAKWPSFASLHQTEHNTSDPPEHNADRSAVKGATRECVPNSEESAQTDDKTNDDDAKGIDIEHNDESERVEAEGEDEDVTYYKIVSFEAWGFWGS